MDIAEAVNVYMWACDRGLMRYETAFEELCSLAEKEGYEPMKFGENLTKHIDLHKQLSEYQR